MAARRKFLFDHNQMMSLCKTIEAIEEDTSTVQTFEVQDLELERRWSLVVASYREFVLEDDKEDHDYNDINGKKFEEVNTQYQKCKSKIMTLICARTQQEQEPSVEMPPATYMPALKLPPCDIPVFEGGYSNWPAFRDIFSAVIINHPHLSPAQKLYHLRGKTRNEAYDIVKKYELIHTNFNLAWEALKNRFENKRILANQQIKKLFNIQSIQNESPKSIREVRTLINDSLEIFKTYDIDLGNSLLIYLVSSKLPDGTLRSWEDSLNNHKEMPSWQQMNEFLSTKIEKLETMIDFKKPNIKDGHYNKVNTFHVSDTENNKPFCTTCQQNHFLTSCNHFKSMSPKQRIEYVMENKRCLNCLSSKHFKPKCPNTKRCQKCNRMHHTMLHTEEKTNERTQKAYQSYNTTNPREEDNPITQLEKGELNDRSEHVNTFVSQSSGATILPTAQIYLKHCGELFSVRALLDAGSEKSFLSKRVQQRLSIPTMSHNSKITGLGGTIVSSSSGLCNVTLQSRHYEFEISINVLIVTNLTHLLPSRPVKSSLLKDVQHLDLADPFFNQPNPIEMIIGSDYLPFINKPGVITQIGNGIEARESQFGWYLSGPTEYENINSFSTLVSANEDISLQQQLKRFWELEEIENQNTKSNEDIWCEEYFQKTTFRKSDGRYVVRLPFKSEYPNDIFLGDSKHTALAQYYRMEKTLQKTPELKNEYDNVLHEYIDLGHMEEVNTSDKFEHKTSYFLPHHAVIRPESKTTKVRVVFNASKTTTSGFSLNNVLHSGPILQHDITNVILNWRFYQYVFNGDIQKMYRQIWIHDDDQHFQQILFRPCANSPVQTYKLKTVTFGINAAPFLALRTLKQLSKDCQNRYPEASNIIEKEVYVDDILSGGHSLAETKSKQNALLNALNSAGFPLKKLTANHNILIENWPREDLLSEEFLKFEDHSSMKTLGIRWNAMTDTFYYASQEIDIGDKTTKRQILSAIAKLFDPLGWIGPTIIIAKILMQDLWEEKAGWDESVSENILKRWTSFAENLKHVSEIKVVRWIQFTPQASVQFHGFSDASEKAYCAAVYIRATNSDGRITSHLLMAKTKVAPIKKTTIPKLELCGALLLAKLMQHVTTGIPFTYEQIVWTDSSIVLGWLQKSPNTLKTFVSNRVAEILSLTSIEQWKYVKTDDNPADIGSRGCIPQNLSSNPLWWHGPSWLTLPIHDWPKSRIFEPTDWETKRTAVYHTHTQVDDILTRFSSLNRCLRVLSYVFRFYQACKKRLHETDILLKDKEISFVKQRLIHLTQVSEFSAEIACIRNSKPVNKKSRLLTLSPFLDEDGLLRVGGRLTNSTLRYEEKHPLIISDKSKFAELLIYFTHQILLHSEHHIMIRAIKQGFYIPRIRNLVRKCIRQCKTCTVFKHRFQSQIMASLPVERVQFSLAFTYAGVDFAGPFNIRSSNLRNAKILKGYASVFVCFSTKAVHLESCSELSADAFMATFNRFISRRGLPKTMFSDNGRNFVGASYNLLKNYNDFLKRAERTITEKYAAHDFNWSYIPPYAPHMGGLWEAAVKSMKTCLKKVAANQNFTFEEFSTILVKIEAILNSRPLTAISENPQELNPLTPGHFLRGAPIISLPTMPSKIPDNNLSLLKRWERVTALNQLFARRWKNEYISELQRRVKWKTTRNNIKENDLVVIRDDLLPPTDWRLGRITKVYYGNDNHVRVADIRTQNGTITRPMTKMPRCHLCHVSHQLKYCPMFAFMIPEQRRRSLENNKMCVNCLAHSHTLNECSSTRRCRYCSDKHHSMLHVQPSNFKAERMKPSIPQQAVYVHPLFRTEVQHNGNKATLTFMVVPTSQHSWLLRSTTTKFPDVQTATFPNGESYIPLELEGLGATFQFKMRLTFHFPIDLPNPIGDTRLRAHFNNFIPLAHDYFHHEAHIDAIISERSWNLIKRPVTIQQDKTLPTVQATNFGWVIYGTWYGCSCSTHVGQAPVHLPQ